MDRFKVAISLVGFVQVMIAAALGSQAVQPPIYPLPPLVALMLVVANAGLVFLAAQMPSWRDSGRASAAVNAVEDRPRDPNAGGDFVG